MALNRLKDSEKRINIDNFVKPSNPLNTLRAMIRNLTILQGIKLTSS